MKDENGNVIAVTQFETYLSKCLIEMPDKFKSVYEKVLLRIKKVIELNKTEVAFDRVFFNVETLMTEQYKNFKFIDDLIERFDLFEINQFIKLFCDYVLKPGMIKKFPAPEDSLKTRSLSVLCQQSLFKSTSGSQAIRFFINPEALFDVVNRGVTQLEITDYTSTKKLGICTIHNTPPNLLTYFKVPHEPAQLEYIPDRESKVGKWLSQYNLPIISGTSGSARDYIELIFRLANLQCDEIQLLIISLAATLIAKGHHSYFEVIIMLDRIGFTLKSATDLFSFYEQTLPKSIRNSKEYIEFKNSKVGAELLAGIPFCDNNENVLISNSLYL